MTAALCKLSRCDNEITMKVITVIVTEILAMFCWFATISICLLLSEAESIDIIAIPGVIGAISMFFVMAVMTTIMPLGIKYPQIAEMDKSRWWGPVTLTVFVLFWGGAAFYAVAHWWRYALWGLGIYCAACVIIAILWNAPELIRSGFIFLIRIVRRR